MEKALFLQHIFLQITGALRALLNSVRGPYDIFVIMTDYIQT